MSGLTTGSMSDPPNSSGPRDSLPPPAAPPPPGRTRRWSLWALLAVILLAAVAITGLSVLAMRNGDRAAEWQRRSEVQAASILELQRILVRRSSDLNFRIRQVNKLTASVRRSQTALRRSESDVSSLASRQRQLADEKAQVEDQRAQLEVESDALASVADAFVDCSEGQSDLLRAVLNQDYSYATAIVNGVVADCQSAYSRLDSYQATYG